MENSPKTVEDVLQASGQFEQRWTEQGIPDSQDTRFLLGFALGRLLRLGAPRDALVRYVEETVDAIADVDFTGIESSFDQ